MSAFESGVAALHEAISSWHRGAAPGLLSRAAVLFDECARRNTSDVRRGIVGGAVARGLAGDLVGARRRLHECIAAHPTDAGAYVALGVLALRDPEPLAHASEGAWALIAARTLAPDVACIERMLAQCLAAEGDFMAALQSARTALTLDRDDDEARLWSALLRLYFGGDMTAATVLAESVEEIESRGRSSAVWLAAAAGLYTRGDFHDARLALRRAIAPLRANDATEATRINAARRWFRELRGFGPAVPMLGERWLRDVGGPQSDFVRIRAALNAFREQVIADPVRARNERVNALEVDGLIGALEARTRRGMLEWGARLILRGFAEAYLPLVAHLEAPTLEALAAMDLVVCDG